MYASHTIGDRKVYVSSDHAGVICSGEASKISCRKTSISKIRQSKQRTNLGVDRLVLARDREGNDDAGDGKKRELHPHEHPLGLIGGGEQHSRERPDVTVDVCAPKERKHPRAMSVRPETDVRAAEERKQA